MAYSKVSNKTQDKDVKYLSKDFQSFKDKLREFTEVYYPQTYRDFSEGSPGMMFLEMAAYVGDVLSFYTDTQIQENFLLLAQENENLYNIAYTLGYTPKAAAAASVGLDVYQLLPSILTTDGSYQPDYTYALIIQEGSTFKSTEGPIFYTTQDVNFSFSSSFDTTEVNIYQYFEDTQAPEYFLLKKTVKAISATLKDQSFTIGNPEQFKTLTLFDSNIISIEKCEDSEGNRWYEVPYLAQDTVFEAKENTATNDPELAQYNQQTPYLLAIKKATRRFATRIKANNELEIQFGAGSSDQPAAQIIPDPDNIGLGIKDGKSELDVAYDPTNFLYTKAYGQVPADTTLTFTYLTGGGIEANVSSNTIIQKDTLKIISRPGANLNTGLYNYIKNSITSANPQKASGGGDADTPTDIRLNTMAAFGAQKRTVTKEDYLIRTLSMPPKFGRVAKAYITQDDQISPLITEPGRFPNPLALNLYTLGYNKEKQLEPLNHATKINLANYLGEYRSLTDSINILDAKQINFKVDFDITTYKDFNNQEVVLNCIEELKEYFDIDKWQVNQPIIISEIYNTIARTVGVQTVEDVRFENVSGEELGYSQYKYSLEIATHSGVIYPSLDPSIFELKYPNTDIYGRVVTY